jgi:hypothetical protein
MNISTNGKIEVVAAIGGVGAGIAGAVLLEPVLLVAGVAAAVVATGLQLREARMRRDVDSSLEKLSTPERIESVRQHY